MNQPDTADWFQYEYKWLQVGSNDTFYIDTGVVGGNTYYYRLTAIDSGFDTMTPFLNESFFTDTKFITADSPPPPPFAVKTWFVNDTSTAGDSYTTAVGADTNTGDSKTAPFRTIVKALQSAHAGDTILVDAGLYAETVVIDTDNIGLIGKDSNATVINPPGAGSTPGLYGVYADLQKGLFIKNIGVTGAYDGIHFDNVDLSVITGDSASANGNYGVYLVNGSDTNTVSGNTANSNLQNGIHLYSSSNNTVSNNMTNSNVNYGILVESNSNYNTLINNTVNSNAEGIHLYSDSMGNTLINNTANSNSDAGIWLNASTGNAIAGNTTNGNAYGLYVEVNSNDNTLSNNVSNGNLQNGIYLKSSMGNTFTGNSLDSNAAYQVYIDVSGTTTSDTFQKNDIRTSSSNPDSGVQNRSNKSFDFSRNWWNTTDELKIDRMVVDTAATKKITFRPYRFGAVDTSPGADTTAPGLVTGIALDTSTPGQIKLSWVLPNINEETNGGSISFNGLNIFRTVNIPDTNNWHNAALLVKQTLSTDTFWTDTNVTGGNTYYYRVTSKDTSPNFNESFFTDTKFVALPPPNPPGLLQILALSGAATFDLVPGETVTLRVIDTGANLNPTSAETVVVFVKNLATNELDTRVLTELDTNNAVFEAKFRMSGNPADNTHGDGKLYVLAGDTVRFDYTDPTDAADTEQVILKVITVLEGSALPADTQIRQGDTAVIFMLLSMNELPKDSASPTDTITGVRLALTGVPDTYVRPGGARMWLDSGIIGKLEPGVDSFLTSFTPNGGECTFPVSGPLTVFAPGDTRIFLFTLEIIDTVPVGETLDASMAPGAIAHALGGRVPDTFINSTGALAVIGGKANVLIGVSQETILAPVSYNGSMNDTVPGATMIISLRYDNDGADTAVGFTLNARIPQSTVLAVANDSTLLFPHLGAAAVVTVTDDSGNAVLDTDPNARRIKWTFTAGIGPNNGDPVGVVDAASQDVDAGYVKYKVYIK